MFDKITRISFIFSILIIIFIFGYFSHKYKAKKIFQTIEPIISYFELKFDIDLDEKIGERKENLFGINSKPSLDTNFSLNNKPNKKFTNPLFVKLDKSFPVLMDNPNNIIWKWNLGKFRNAHKLIPYLLLNDGDIILGRYETKGLYRIDKNGKIKWEKDYYNHHWISHDENFIYVPGTIFLDNKNDLNEKIYEGSFIKTCKSKHKSRFGTILIIDKKNGNLIKEISLIESFYKEENSKNLIEKFATNCNDTLHLNDVRVLTNSNASYFDDASEGDFLVSFRSLDMITLIDKDTHHIKWFVQGKFKSQHSPRITKKGTLLVFDNYFKPNKSRIVEIDIKSKEIKGYYSGNDHKFYSSTRGRIQLFDDRIIIQSSDQGEIFEIICNENTSFLNNKECKSKYLFSAIFSGFYPNTGFSIDGEYVKDQIYIGDFYKNLNFLKK